MSPRTTRRCAIEIVAGAAGGIAIVGLPACSGSGGRAAPEQVTRVARESLQPGARLKIDHHGEPVELRLEGDRVEARSLICTHEYCKMFWHPATRGYRCPCHGAVFGADGRPVSGPIRVPMSTLPVRVEGDEIVVGGV